MTKVLLDTDKAAVIGAVSGATITDAGTPASDDKVLIQDTSDSDNLKYVDISELPTGGGGGATPAIEDFSSSGTWTKPAGLSYIIVEIIGGGGNGGNGNSGSDSGSGGGAGGYSKKIIEAADLAATETVTVGAAGNTSSFTIDSVTGFQATGGTNGTSGGDKGGEGGVGSGGDLNFYGGEGGGGMSNSYLSAGGIGGSSFLGGGGSGGAQDSNSGNDGVVPGSGGGGGMGNNSGSPSGGGGATGRVTVTAY